MSNFEKAKNRAQQAALRDHEQGLPPDSSRHYACAGSAFDTWYMQEYKRITTTVENKTVDDIDDAWNDIKDADKWLKYIRGYGPEL